MHPRPDLDQLIARVRTEATRPEYQSPPAEPLGPLTAPDSFAPAASPSLTPTPSLEPESIRSVDDLLLVADPERFVDLAYRTLLRRPPDPTGGGYYRERLASGFGQPFVLAALRASDEARALKAPPLPGFGLAPLVYILWRYGRGVGLGVPGRWVNLAYHHWRRLRLAFTGRSAAHEARECERLAVGLQALQQGLEDAREAQSAQSAEVDRELALLRARLKVLQQRRYPEHPVPSPALAASAADSALAERIGAYYLAFEEAHRGSESEIADKLEHYLQDVAALPETLLDKPMLDLGCGRGEWLRLLGEQGFHAVGVDLNPDMAARARAAGLEVHCADALNHLISLPDASLALVSGFHIVEHLPFETLFQILEQAWRVLAPGGRLLLETPNPENVLVGSHTFYHDFSHRNPVTPTSLGFLVGYQGFADLQWRRLHPYPESARIAAETPLGERFSNHLYGPQDYALIATKPELPSRADA